MKKDELKRIVESRGQKYSEILGIDLSGGREEEVFKWFLASVLFGAPITETSVIKTYRAFERHDVLTPKRIFRAGWDQLVKILDEGSYSRYDFKTADKLLEVMRNLLEKYDGSLSLICNQALNARDLESRIKGLGKGIGDVTVTIFLRELRDVWQKADPNPTELVTVAARELGLIKREATADEALSQLKDFWAKNEAAGKSFVNFETALLRTGKEIRRKRRSTVFG